MKTVAPVLSPTARYDTPMTTTRYPQFSALARAVDHSPVPEPPVIDAHVHTYPSRAIGRQAMMGSGRTDYGGV